LRHRHLLGEDGARAQRRQRALPGGAGDRSRGHEGAGLRLPGLVLRGRPAPAPHRPDREDRAGSLGGGRPMSTMERPLREADPEVADALLHETERQARGLELIASENFVSEAVLEAMGSVLTNKYAEGYPGRRYYGGCEFSDVVERLAIERAKQMFGAEHANVQPHSGAQANMAVYF